MRGRVDELVVPIRDPAEAVALAKCWLARWNGGQGAQMAGLQTVTFHPHQCRFCAYRPEAMIKAVEEFLDWSGITPAQRYTDELVSQMRADVESFLTLPVEEQEKLVQEAQGYRSAD